MTPLLITVGWLVLLAAVLACTAWAERHVVDLPEHDEDGAP